MRQGAKTVVSNDTQGDSRGAKKEGGPSAWVTRGRVFTDEAVAELKRVYWPSRKETTSFTWVVLAVVGFVALYLGVIDYVISLAMRLVF